MLQLFCIPYAGGTSASYNTLTQFLAEEPIDVIVLEYAGHGTRVKEPGYDSFDAMASDIFHMISKRRIKEIPYAILGYSMGSIVAYEILTKYIPSTDLPAHIFLAAHFPPDAPGESYDYWRMDDQTFIETLESFGGIPEILAKNKRFLALYTKPLRHDYWLLGHYDYKEAVKKICGDVTFFYCEKDTPYIRVKDWSNLIEGLVTYYELGNNHFFINTHTEEMAAAINKILLSKQQ